MTFPSNLVAAGPVSQSSPARLTLGIVLESYRVPAWIYYLVEKLTSCDGIQPYLVVLSDPASGPAGLDRAPILFRCWAALDRWVRRSKTDALQLRNCRLMLKGDRSVPVFLLRTCTGKPKSQVDIASIKEANLDLVLYLGSDLRGIELSGCARLGAWVLQQSTGVPGQFWDMYEGNRTVRYGPQVVEHKHNRTRVLYRASGITSFLSLALNQNACYWEIAQFLLTKLTDSERLPTDMQFRSEADSSQRPIRRTLGNIGMAGFLVRWATGTLRHELEKRLFREQWSIALQRKTEMPKINSEQCFKILRPPEDRFYADPFLVERNGCTYLFFEDYRFASQKGCISCCEVDAEGNCGEPRVVLERKYHLSYPFLFTWQGQVYMVPETRANGTIEMYRASDFPYSWVYEAVLMPGVAAADSTLLHYRGKWWLFTAGVLDHSSPNQALFLFFADSPLGPWTAHPKNPIVSDPRHSRPAGCLYFDEGQLIRPGQDCSLGYGYAAQLHRVDVLSETEYQESLMASITPDWIRGSRGIHTFNQSALFWVLDCKFLIPRFRLLHVLSACEQIGSSV